MELVGYWGNHMNRILEDLINIDNRDDVKGVLGSLDTDVIDDERPQAVITLEALVDMEEFDIIDKWLTPWLQDEPTIIYDNE